MKYRTIVADPPWPIETSALARQRQRDRGFLPYSTMSIEAIEALPVKPLSQSDVAGNRSDKTIPRDGSLLFLWTTTAFLEVAHRVARAWGFTPTVVLVWCKSNRANDMGGTFPANVEFVIVGRRGSPKPYVGQADTRWFTWPRGRHSEKPEAFFDLVEAISHGPYLELFARRQRLGWDTWGDEALEHVTLDGAA